MQFLLFFSQQAKVLNICNFWKKKLDPSDIFYKNLNNFTLCYKMREILIMIPRSGIFVQR